MFQLKRNRRNKKARLIQEYFDSMPTAPVEKLRQEAEEFEKMIAQRMASIK